MTTLFGEAEALRNLNRDGRLLFLTRSVRLFAYGFLSVVLTLYLAERGFSEKQIGLILTLTLVGDAALSLWIASAADRIGRRRMLILGAALMIFASLIFAFSGSLPILIIAAVIGTISPSGSEVGPFLSIEQAILPQTAPDKHRTRIFAWYNLVGSFATAFGALCGGSLAQFLQQIGTSRLDSYRSIVAIYGILGALLGLIFFKLSSTSETETSSGDTQKREFGLHRSKSVVMKLSALFAVDALAGGLIVQSLIAYWFYIRFNTQPAVLGGIFFGGNLLAGMSALLAARAAARFGLINTMVFTHIPSNILLIFVPLMPNQSLAIFLLLARFSISQMDVPTRQSYVMSVVAPDERSAAAGITSIVRTAAASVAPIITGILMNYSLLSLPFYLAGGLKIIYDLALYKSFRALKPPEEIRTYKEEK